MTEYYLYGVDNYRYADKPLVPVWLKKRKLNFSPTSVKTTTSAINKRTYAQIRTTAMLYVFFILGSMAILNMQTNQGCQ
jgi:hypothetical protein